MQFNLLSNGVRTQQNMADHSDKGLPATEPSSIEVRHLPTNAVISLRFQTFTTANHIFNLNA